MLARAEDLKNTIIIEPPGARGPEHEAALLLQDEIAKRTRIRLRIGSHYALPAPAILLGEENELRALAPALARQLVSAAPGADGYRVQSIDNAILIAGNDPRGTLFGAGWLLRKLRMERDIVEAPDDLKIATKPQYALRGHQLGYRPKTNSYDG
jgi:hypothetical protein